MGELGFPELTTEQIELLCQTAEAAARKFVLSKVSQKDIDQLDISVEADGCKPVAVTVEVDLILVAQTKEVDADQLVKEATAEAHRAIEIFLRKLK